MKTLIRIALIILAMLCGVASLPAQMLTVVASTFSDSTQKPITGTLLLTQTLANGTPTAYQLGGGGWRSGASVSVYVSAGVLSIPLPDTSLTSPSNLCFRLSSTSPSIILGPGYNCLQPASTGQSSWCTTTSGVTVCDLGKYTPPLAPLVQSVAGPTGPTGPTGATGATPTVAVGPTSVGVPGSLPVVTNSGTPTAAVLNFQFSAAVSPCVILADGNPLTVPMANSPGYCGEVTLSHTLSTRTVNITGLVNGSFFELILIQDATGGANATGGTGCVWYLGTDSGYVANSTFNLTAAANAANILTGFFDGTNCWANLR